MGELLGALDQGTTSTRFIVFATDGREVVRHQEEHRQLMAHLARAALEAIAYQTRDVVEVMTRETNISIPALRVDGGVTVNSLAMQIQADVLGRPVIRPSNIETTAVGAAWAAGLALGLYADIDELRQLWCVAQRWTPRWSEARRMRGTRDWTRAVSRSLDWYESDERELREGVV
jgi:glycerol kinase